MIPLERKVDDIVLLNTKTSKPVAIAFLHSGYYDYQYTGYTNDGEVVYFNEEDICEDFGC